MLTAEIKINGAMIGHLYAVNQTPTLSAFDIEPLSEPTYIYTFEYYEPEKEIVRGTVVHSRSDGAVTLVAKIMSKVNKERKC